MIPVNLSASWPSADSLLTKTETFPRRASRRAQLVCIVTPHPCTAQNTLMYERAVEPVHMTQSLFSENPMGVAA